MPREMARFLSSSSVATLKGKWMVFYLDEAYVVSDPSCAGFWNRVRSRSH